MKNRVNTYPKTHQKLFEAPISVKMRFFAILCLETTNSQPPSFYSRFVLEYSYQAPACGAIADPPPRWWVLTVKNLHFLNFGVILWLISGVITVVVSLLTPPMDKEYLYR